MVYCYENKWIKTIRIKAGTAVQQFKLLPIRPVSPMSAHSSAGIQLPIQLPINARGKTAKDGPSTWVPATMWETQKK